MRFIDIGVNLMHPSFNADREGVIEAAGAAGVSPLIITGTSEAASRGALYYAALYGRKNPGRLYATVGVHPHEARRWGPHSAGVLQDLVRRGGELVVAAGECGLDYNRDFSPRPLQRKCFEAQLELARGFHLPVFLHQRDAFDDFAAILGEHRGGLAGAVVHCFTGDGRELERCLELDCHIGITGWICDERRGSGLWDLVKRIPPERLMLETDAPFLLPRDMGRGGRSGRNEPRHLPHIAAAIAKHLDKPLAQVAEESFAASLGFFGLTD